MIHTLQPSNTSRIKWNKTEVSSNYHLSWTIMGLVLRLFLREDDIYLLTVASRSWTRILGSVGELGRLISLATLRNLELGTPSLEKTGEHGREAVSRSTSVPRARATAWGCRGWTPEVNVFLNLVVAGEGEASGELEREYSRIPSGCSKKSGHITRESWERPGDRDLDLNLCLAEFSFDCEEVTGLGRVKLDDEDIVSPALAATCWWSRGLYIFHVLLHNN